MASGVPSLNRVKKVQGVSACRLKFAATAPLAAPTPITMSERPIMVSSQAMERLYEIAPCWDKHFLENLYIAWAKEKEPARNEDARFLNWVGSYTKSKPAP